jgi:hypothetical protein
MVADDMTWRLGIPRFRANMQDEREGPDGRKAARESVDTLPSVCWARRGDFVRRGGPWSGAFLEGEGATDASPVVVFARDLLKMLGMMGFRGKS